MTHASPCSLLVWSGLVTLLASFLVFHLWSFDRFKCLRWNNGPDSGAFKRFMTYSYLITVPLIMAYTVGNTIVKYREGFIDHPQYGIIPKPHKMWSKSSYNTIFPLMLTFSIGWSFEMVTHLEELCFWLFLVNSGSTQHNWFTSHYFKTWIVGSAIAIAYMPLVSIFTRSDPLKAEAYTFLAGSLGSLSLTLWFTPILWTFPSFLNNLRREGVDTATVVRLTKFSELNTIRVIFRFLFTVPFLILGVDGVRPHNHINESMAITDLLVVIAGFGCAISSAITLVIFFPRSIEGEIAARDARMERKRLRSQGLNTINETEVSQRDRDTVSRYELRKHQTSSAGGTYLLTSSPVKTTSGLESMDGVEGDRCRRSFSMDQNKWIEDEPNEIPPLQPNRRRARDVEMGAVSTMGTGLTETNLSLHNIQYGTVNPAISNFTSPIDFAYASHATQPKSSRLTFRK